MVKSRNVGQVGCNGCSPNSNSISKRNKSQWEHTKTNVLPVSANEQISWIDLTSLSVEELEELLLRMYASQEHTFRMICSYAQGTTHIEAPFQSVTELENNYKQTWGEMKAVIDALLYHAIFADSVTPQGEEKS